MVTLQAIKTEAAARAVTADKRSALQDFGPGPPLRKDGGALLGVVRSGSNFFHGEAVMCSSDSPREGSEMEMTLSQLLRMSVETIERISGLVDALRDSIENAAESYDDRFATRLYVCEYIDQELKTLAVTLDSLGPALTAG
jgi:hypothetical protein